MTSPAVLIRNGRVIDPAIGLDTVADVLLADGFVARIGSNLTAPDAAVLDATGCIVAPGFVDLHAHLREPGFEQKGTIATETFAALRGGFTTVCAMPNTNPAPDSAPVVAALLERIARDARVRVLPIGTVTRRREGKQLADLAELAGAGVVALSDDGSPVANATLMRNALTFCAALGIPLSEHSDDPELHGSGVMHEGRVSERLGLAGEPAAAEVAAIARNLALCEATVVAPPSAEQPRRSILHVAHLSTARGVELIAEAKRRGLPVTCEVTPSHLLLTEDAVFGGGREPTYDTNARINPPLRSEDDRRALLAGLNDGTIDAIATDHAPHAREDKLCEFDLAAPGISCFETALGTVQLLVDRGELEFSRALAAMTTGPVRAFGLGTRVPGIGALTPGLSSDVVVFDPGARWTVDLDSFVSKGKNSPLHGRELIGRVRAVAINGSLTPIAEPAHV
jgi:dihydroorotase